MSTQDQSAKRDLESMSFEERLQLGAENAVRCMGVTHQDRVFLITDLERESIASRIAAAALARHADVSVHVLEHYGTRPLTAIPDQLRDDLLQAHPTVTYYIATSKSGEISFRMPLRLFLNEALNTRHAHMIGINEQLMTEGMCADYDEVFRLTNQVYEIVRKATKIHVTSVKGSDVTATFRQDWNWIPCHGRYTEQGLKGNLPEGEVFTTPAKLDGVLVCDVLGDYFSEKYGVLKQPVTLIVKDSYVTHVACEDAAIEKDVRDYLFSTPYSNRAGEFAIGTLTSLKHLTGNLLQDEKMPGLHVAFGNPYPEQTKADWHAKTHIDVIPTCCTIEVDGREIMRDGVFTI